MGRRPEQRLTFAPDDSAADAVGLVWIDQDVPMIVACRFPHDSEVSRYELGSVPGERLKRQLVECVFTMSEPDRGVGSSSSVQRYVGAIRSFLRFLGGDAARAGLADLDDGVVDPSKTRWLPAMDSTAAGRGRS